MMHDAYYFGCLRDVGHQWFEPTQPGCVPFLIHHLAIDSVFPPWQFDAQYAPTGVNQRQGFAKLSHKNNWTVLAWWDRSIDSRGNSNSAVVKRGRHSFEEMLECLEHNWPEVMARQPASICLIEEPSA